MAIVSLSTEQPTDQTGKDPISARRVKKGSSSSRPSRRVLFVVEAFGGGLFEVVRMQAAGLAARGYEVAVAYGRRPETPLDVASTMDPRVDLFPLPWTERSVKAQFKAQRALRKVIEAWRPDILHPMSSFAGIQTVMTRQHLPRLYTPQAYSFTMSDQSTAMRWALLSVESFVAGHVNVVGACSLSEGEQARSLPGARHVVTVPNGIELLDNAPASGSVRPDLAAQRNPNQVEIAGMGRLRAQRRPKACARIFKQADVTDRAIWIGGGAMDSPEAKRLRDVDVPITGWLPHERAVEELGKRSIYLHWTAWDGLPLSILEAMALDVIVVASDIGPNREVVGVEQVCSTESEAAALIKRLMTEPELRERFLEHQRLRRGAYSSEVMIDRWVDVYEHLLNRIWV